LAKWRPCRVWLTTTLRLLVQPSLPEIRNFEGEAVQFCATRLPVLDLDNLAQIETRLDALAELARVAADRLEWTWLAPSAPQGERRPGADHPSRLQGLAEEGSQLLGQVRLERDALVLETNSTGRAERGRDLLAAVLGPLVGPPLTSVQTPAQALAEDRTAAPRAPAAQLSLSLDEQNAALEHVLDRHYRATLDAPLPALDGKTPRQAVRSKAGREKAARWLKYLENQTARRARMFGQPGYDFAWMWQALKIDDLRR
jgi:hypothetical protein